MTGYVADLSWKSGARAIEKLDRLRSTMAVNVLTQDGVELKVIRTVSKRENWTLLNSRYKDIHKHVMKFLQGIVAGKPTTITAFIRN